MICGVTQGSGGPSLGKHLASAENEQVRLLENNGLFGETIEEQIQELTDLASHARTRTPIIHAHVDPEPGQPWSEEARERFWRKFEAEHHLEGNLYASVIHSKNGRDHEHRAYLGLTDRGTKIRLGNDRLAREFICRLTEFQEGHTLVKGRHNVAVYNRAVREDRHEFAAALVAAGLLDGKPAIARMTPGERMQQKQNGVSVNALRAAALDAFRSADNGPAFRAALADRGLNLAQGKSQVLIVDQTGAHHGLNRVLRAAAKDSGQPPIAAADSRAMLTGIRLPTLAAVQATVRGAQPKNTETRQHGNTQTRAAGPSIGPAAVAGAGATVTDTEVDVDLFSGDELAAAKSLKRWADAEKRRLAALESITPKSGGADAAEAAHRLASLIFTGGHSVNKTSRGVDRPAVHTATGRAPAERAIVYPARRAPPQTLQRVSRLQTLDTLSTQQRVGELRRSDILRGDARDRARVGQRRIHHSLQQQGGAGGDRGGLTARQRAASNLTTAKQSAVTVLATRPKLFNLASLTAKIDADVVAKLARITRQADRAEQTAIAQMERLGWVAIIFRTAEFRAAQQVAERADSLRARADLYETAGRYTERRDRVAAAEIKFNGKRAEQQKFDTRPEVRRANQTAADVTAIRALCKSGDEPMIAAAAQGFDVAQKFLRQREQEERKRLAR